MDLLRSRLIGLLVAGLIIPCAGCDAWRGGKAPGPADRAAPDFSLLDTAGNAVTLQDLRGKVWIASFMFTRCTLGCPQVAETVRDLQNRLRDRKDLLFVTFAVDPDRDNAEDLNRYANHFGADQNRWIFLRTRCCAIVHSSARTEEKLPTSTPVPACSASGATSDQAKISRATRPATFVSRKSRPA